MQTRQLWGPEGHGTVAPATAEEKGSDFDQKNPDAPWECHICRSVGVVWGVNVGIYGIHGASGKGQIAFLFPTL